MFFTNKPFIEWLQANAEPIVSPIVTSQPGSTQAALRRIFENHGTIPANTATGGPDMLDLARALGMAVAEIVKLALGFKGFDGEDRVETLQTFAIECSVALFRLIDRGPDSSQYNLRIQRNTVEPAMFNSQEAWEAGFARPLVEQAVASTFRTLEQARSAAPPRQPGTEQLGSGN